MSALWLLFCGMLLALTVSIWPDIARSKWQETLALHTPNVGEQLSLQFESSTAYDFDGPVRPREKKPHWTSVSIERRVGGAVDGEVTLELRSGGYSVTNADDSKQRFNHLFDESTATQWIGDAEAARALMRILDFYESDSDAGTESSRDRPSPEPLVYGARSALGRRNLVNWPKWIPWAVGIALWLPVQWLLYRLYRRPVEFDAGILGLPDNRRVVSTQ